MVHHDALMRRGAERLLGIVLAFIGTACGGDPAPSLDDARLGEAELAANAQINGVALCAHDQGAQPTRTLIRSAVETVGGPGQSSCRGNWECTWPGGMIPGQEALLCSAELSQVCKAMTYTRLEWVWTAIPDGPADGTPCDDVARAKPPSCHPTLIAPTRVATATCEPVPPPAPQMDCPAGQIPGAPEVRPMCKPFWTVTGTLGWTYVAKWAQLGPDGKPAVIDFACQYRRPCTDVAFLVPQTDSTYDAEGNLTGRCKALGGDNCSELSSDFWQLQANVPIKSWQWRRYPPNQSEESAADFEAAITLECRRLTGQQQFPDGDTAQSAAWRRANEEKLGVAQCKSLISTRVDEGPKTYVSCCKSGGGDGEGCGPAGDAAASCVELSL